jgi:ABC-2 type transport system ATP-binding protein
MSDPIAISVKNVSKDFLLPHQKTSSIKDVFIRPIQALRGTKKIDVQHALRDISFDVKEGEFFGIVGRNGSGKSTLLKILAEIYQPTSGEVSVKGRLVPFIELGVGFNPELTGRENVYLSGALNGFSEKEIDDMYDDIVEFAELGPFMDQKLKNYSSGMQVRLAFSVATRSEADILVLDEILAVGDEAFQRKCDQFFRRIKKDKTKTVVLVTHSMDAVRRFCDRALLIHDSNVKMIGSTEDVTNQYTEDNYQRSDQKKPAGKEAGLSERVPFFKVTSGSKRVLSSKDELVFDIEYEIADETPVRVFISIVDKKRNVPILAIGTEPIAKKGRNKLTYVFPLGYYNDCDLLVNAVLDEADTEERIAFTSESNSLVCATRNSESDGGLLRKDKGIHGHWKGYKEFTYNMKEREIDS